MTKRPARPSSQDKLTHGRWQRRWNVPSLTEIFGVLLPCQQGLLIQLFISTMGLFLDIGSVGLIEECYPDDMH